MKPSDALNIFHSNTKKAKSRVSQSQVCYLHTTHSSVLKDVLSSRLINFLYHCKAYKSEAAVYKITIDDHIAIFTNHLSL